MNFIKSLLRRMFRPIPAYDAKCIVNGRDEPKVCIGNFLYNGEPVVYSEAHTDGTRMLQRAV